MEPSLDIVITNRNSGRHLRHCLSSIAEADKRGIKLERIVIVDDASSDDSLRDIERFNLPLHLLRKHHRIGYGRCCNQGAAGSRADCLLFLNTDVRLGANSLTVPLRYLGNPDHARAAIAGISLLEPSGEVSRSCARFPTLSRFMVSLSGLDHLFPSMFRSHQMKEWDHHSPREVDQVMGAFMLIRRSVFERLHGYDERFFVYMEDLDLSLRSKKLGYESIYLSDAAALHEGGGTANRVKAESLFFMLRSRLQYGFKHFGLLRGLLLLFATMTFEPLARLGLAAWRGSGREIAGTLQAYVLLWRALPGLWLKASAHPRDDVTSRSAAPPIAAQLTTREKER